MAFGLDKEATEAHRQASQQAGFQVHLDTSAETNMACYFKLASSCLRQRLLIVKVALLCWSTSMLPLS